MPVCVDSVDQIGVGLPGGHVEAGFLSWKEVVEGPHDLEAFYESFEIEDGVGADAEARVATPIALDAVMARDLRFRGLRVLRQLSTRPPLLRRSPDSTGGGGAGELKRQ
jgi:hypothetical protein